MRLPFFSKNEEKNPSWSVLVPRDKWAKAVSVLHDECGRDHLVIDNIEEDETLKVVVTFWSTMPECATYLSVLTRNGIEVVMDDSEEEKEEKKEVKKKK